MPYAWYRDSGDIRDLNLVYIHFERSELEIYNDSTFGYMLQVIHTSRPVTEPR